MSNLGGGLSTFTNNGTLALLGGPGAATLDATGQYLPLGLTFNSMALGGPVQGQILGATTFTNSGTINLQANPVAGDVLLISGGHTPGANGGGTFISNGGRLLIDTVLNEGGANSRSDVLVVDGTSVGAGGASRLFVGNVGGAGALTVGDGIAVVQVLDPVRSAGGVFALCTGGGWPLRIYFIPGRRRSRCGQRQLVPALHFELHPGPDNTGVSDTGAYTDDPELPCRDLALCSHSVDDAVVRTQSARHTA